MKPRTFIEYTYEQMKKANVVRSSEQFSTDFLGKSRSYYRAMKSQGLEANTAMLTHLVNELNRKRTFFEKVGSGDLDFYYAKWRAIENEVAEELALRATANGCINTHALMGVFRALQALITQRQQLTT